MSEVITNMKVRFGADTKQFKKGMNEGKKAVQTFQKDAGSSLEAFANQFGVSLGPLSGIMNKTNTAAKGLSAGMKSAAQGTSLMAKAMKILKVALVATGIGALVVLVGSLVTAFSRFQTSNDKLAVKLAGLKAIVNVVLDRIGRLGEAVMALLRGDFKGAGEKVREAFEGIGDEMQREFEIGQRLKELLIDLERRSKLFDAERETAMTEIKALRAIAKDRLATDKERLAAVKKANEIEQRIADRSLKLAEEELAAALDQYDVKSNSLKLSEDAAKLVERIKKGEIGALEAQEKAKELTLDDANARDTLYGIIDKIVAREKEQQSIIQTRLRLQNAENTVREEMLNKEIAGLKSLANLKETQANNDRLDIEEKNKLLKESAQLQVRALEVALAGNKIDQVQYAADILKIYQDLREQLTGEVEKIKSVTAVQYFDAAEIKATAEKAKKEFEGSFQVLQNIELFESDKITNWANELTAGLEPVKGVLIDLSSSFNSLFEDIGLGFAETIGNLLAGTGGIEDFGTIVVSSLAKLAVTIGQIIMKAGIAFFAIGEAFQKALTNPATALLAVAAGAALIAVGKGLQASLSSAASGGSGTFSSNSGVYDSRNSSTPNTTPGNYSRQPQAVAVTVTGEFRQRGTDMVATINETQKRSTYAG